MTKFEDRSRGPLFLLEHGLDLAGFLLVACGIVVVGLGVHVWAWEPRRLAMENLDCIKDNSDYDL